jgi:hypothetical protein
MSKNIDIAQRTAKEITEIAVTFEIKGQPMQFTSSIAPIISNVIYNREKEILKEERFRTIIRLAKNHNEDIVLALISNLEYEITVKK